jgi:hypothetical protein
MQKSTKDYSLSQFMVEYIMEIVRIQNTQLLKLIAEEEYIPYKELMKLIPTHKDIIKYTKYDSMS